MDHPLIGPSLKLNRARHHLDSLQRFLDERVFDPRSYSVVADLDMDALQPVLRVQKVKPPDNRVGVFVGDVVHNLRSALDHLAYALNVVGSQDPPPNEESSQFPLYSVRSKYRNMARTAAKRPDKCMVGYFPRGARTVIEKLQPYHRRQQPELKALWRLSELSNMDKHRFIPVTVAVLAGSQFEFEWSDPQVEIGPYEVIPGPLKEDAVIARLDVRPLNAKVKVKADLELDVAFDEVRSPEPLKGLFVPNTLDEIGSFIEHGVIPRFKRFFPA